MNKVLEGRIIAKNSIREFFSKKHKTDICCSIIKGISGVLSVRFSEEKITESSIDNLTPYWRTIKSNGELNPKYLGGVVAQKRFRRDEGYKKGNRYFVSEFEKYLISKMNIAF